MVNVKINSVNTTREEREIYREFVNSSDYNFCKFSQELDTSRRVIGDWFIQQGYEFIPNNKDMIDYIAFKI